MTSKQPTAAIIQVSSHAEFAQRLKTTEALCRQSAETGAQLLVLPENFAYYGEKGLPAVADNESTPAGPVRQLLATLACELGVWIVGGTLPMWSNSGTHSGSKPFATTLIFSPPAANKPLRYDKIHLFDVDLPERSYRESDSYTPGNGKTLVFDTPLGKVGVVICFDLRFPELALALRDQGAEIIVAPSAFTRETGQAHWQLLLQARALDSQCYVLGANLAGRDHQQPTWGGSTAVDPWGKVVDQMDDEEGFITVAIDRQKLEDIRRNLPLSRLPRLTRK